MSGQPVQLEIRRPLKTAERARLVRRAKLLAGLGVNALFGLWWADPLTALLIAGVAVKEGQEAWQGETYGCCATGSKV